MRVRGDNTEESTWRIKQIFDGDYGCEEPVSGSGWQVSVTLVNAAGEEKMVSASDAWLTERGLDIGSAWPIDRVVLASASPRRKELLGRILTEFEIIPAKGEEVSTAADPQDYVRELSFHKASEVLERVTACHSAAKRAQPGGMNIASAAASDVLYVIGADTIVVCDGQIMGKPQDRRDAYRMIHCLQGRSHEVMTGVTILRQAAEEIRKESYTCVTEVTVAPMTDSEIRRYLDTGEADDKAGAYGIQGAFSLYVTDIHGSYSNVVGLPVAQLYQSLRRMGCNM